MGCTCSSQEEEEPSAGNQMKHIYYDREGNLRSGHVLNDRDDELRQVVMNDSLSIKRRDEDGLEWYVIDSNWFNSWLSFAHLDKNVCPSPGPCRNDRLITFDESTKRWVPRESLVETTKRSNGNYSIICQNIWELFRDHYPGSGPEIKLVYHRSHTPESDAHEIYPPSRWIIDQRGCPEVSKNTEEGKNHLLSSKQMPHETVTKSNFAFSEGSTDTEDEEEDVKTAPKRSREGRTRGHYEHMMDDNISDEDRVKIWNFFGSLGEDMDFHQVHNEGISDKYEQGLEKMASQRLQNNDQEEDLLVPVSPERWLFGEQDNAL